MSLPFPVWLRATHILNILFLSLLVRSGLEILSAHPKLYWNEECRPGGEWVRFTKKRMPTDRLWTSRDEEESFSSLVALPGRKNLGLGRHWHFASLLAWIATGVTYIGLLFITGQWHRIFPTSWHVVPEAWSDLVTYAHLRLPTEAGYDALEQLTYGAVVFLLAPFMIATGAAQSPAVIGRFPGYARLFGGRQTARSLHFLSLVAFAAFTLVHTVMVVVHGLPEGLAKIVMGVGEANAGPALAWGVLGLVLIAAVHVIATRQSLRRPRAVKHVLDRIVGPVQRCLAHRLVSRQSYARSDISSFFRVNGRPPAGEAYRRMAASAFVGYRLEIGGLVRHPLQLSLGDLRALPRRTQITKHNCIQGWSNVAEWTGVALGDVLDLAGVLPEARYLVIRALDDKSRSEPDPAGPGRFYGTLDLDDARHPQTMLAYEMNGRPLPVAHGAPIRVRVEDQLGFKMVKYVESIELVEDYTHIGAGEGGWREDHQHYFTEAGL